MMERRIYLYTLLAMISKGLVNIFVFFASILLIRILTKEDYGKYSYVSSIASIFGVLINFGLSNYFVREMSRETENAKAHFATFLGMQISLALAVFVILTGIAFSHDDPDYFFGILLFGGGICITSLVGPFMGFLTARL